MYIYIYVYIYIYMYTCVYLVTCIRLPQDSKFKWKRFRRTPGAVGILQWEVSSFDHFSVTCKFGFLEVWGLPKSAFTRIV